MRCFLAAWFKQFVRSNKHSRFDNGWCFPIASLATLCYCRVCRRVVALRLCLFWWCGVYRDADTGDNSDAPIGAICCYPTASVQPVPTCQRASLWCHPAGREPYSDAKSHSDHNRPATIPNAGRAICNSDQGAKR
jgi:hypothetical protein